MFSMRESKVETLIKNRQLTIDTAPIPSNRESSISPLSPMEPQSPITESKISENADPSSSGFQDDSHRTRKMKKHQKRSLEWDMDDGFEGSALNDLRAQFEKKEQEEGDGLNLPEFVETFLVILNHRKRPANTLSQI